jgi:tetratricopeptide (TPR) repeat protein
MASSGPRLDPATLRKSITKAFVVRGFAEYRAMSRYVDRVLGAVDSIEDLLQAGQATEVIGLAEHALARAESALGKVDDSDGGMREVFDRLHDLHLRACGQAQPDPEALARRLFAREADGDWDVFAGAATRYAVVFGERGLAVYRKLAEVEWAKVPALAPGQDDDPERYGKRFRITQIMETLARMSGDVGAVAAVLQRDLASPYKFFLLAELHHQAGDADRALEWAERGLKSFPTRLDPRLCDFLVAEYVRRGRHDDALSVRWTEFSARIMLERFTHLKELAETLGAWPAWREKALAHVSGRIGPGGHSELVQVFLWDGDDESAWREAKEGGCRKDLWLELAVKREKLHPADAVEALQKLIEPTLEARNNEAYRTAAGYLRRIGKLMGRLGQDEEFRRLLASIRASHKAKRNFIKLLDEAGWG